MYPKLLWLGQGYLPNGEAHGNEDEQRWDAMADQLSRVWLHEELL